VEIEGIKEWEIEKILNKRKIREVEKYLVWWKGFMAEGDTWGKKENLKNVGEALEEFEGRINVEIRRQEKIDMAVLWNTLDTNFFLFSFIYFS